MLIALLKNDKYFYLAWGLANPVINCLVLTLTSTPQLGMMSLTKTPQPIKALLVSSHNKNCR